MTFLLPSQLSVRSEGRSFESWFKLSCNRLACAGGRFLSTFLALFSFALNRGAPVAGIVSTVLVVTYESLWRGMITRVCNPYGVLLTV